jgi:hypothetical protein
MTLQHGDAIVGLSGLGLMLRECHPPADRRRARCSRVSQAILDVVDAVRGTSLRELSGNGLHPRSTPPHCTLRLRAAPAHGGRFTLDPAPHRGDQRGDRTP